jgi:hypothetical protein
MVGIPLGSGPKPGGTARATNAVSMPSLITLGLVSLLSCPEPTEGRVLASAKGGELPGVRGACIAWADRLTLAAWVWGTRCLVVYCTG